MQRILSPVLFLFLLLVLALLWVFHPGEVLMRPDQPMPWDIPLAVGLVVLLWTGRHFSKRKAEIHTFREPALLIDDGRSASAEIRSIWASRCCFWLRPSLSTAGAPC